MVHLVDRTRADTPRPPPPLHGAGVGDGDLWQTQRESGREFSKKSTRPKTETFFTLLVGRIRVVGKRFSHVRSTNIRSPPTHRLESRLPQQWIVPPLPVQAGVDDIFGGHVKSQFSETFTLNVD